MWMPIQKGTYAGFQIGVSPYNINTMSYDTSYGMKDWSPGDNSIDTHTDMGRIYNENPSNVLDLYAKGKLIYKKKKIEMWGTMAMTYSNLKLDNGINEIFALSADSTTFGQGIMVTLDSTLTLNSGSGSGKNNEFAMFGKIIHKPSNNVRFALGMNIVRGNGEFTTTIYDSTYKYELYNDGDNQLNDPDDSIAVTISSDTIINRLTYVYTYLSNTVDKLLNYYLEKVNHFLYVIKLEV